MRHLRSLDGARGAAACLVAVDHFILSIFDPAPESLLRYAAIFLGGFGVGLFFLISGFVIPQTLRRGTWDYAARRIFRIYPVAIVGALFALASDRLLGGTNETFGLTVSLVGMFFDWNHLLLQPIYWTLTVELTFYGLAGVIGALTHRTGNDRLPYYALLAACVLGVVLMQAQPAVTSPVRYTTLMVLSCWPMLFVGWFVHLRRCGTIDEPLFLIGLGTAFLTLSQGIEPNFSWNSGAPSWILAFAVFSTLVFGNPPRLPAVLARALLHVGKATFPIYVLHVPILNLVVFGQLPVPLAAAVFVAAVALASTVVHLAVERPGIAVGKRLAEVRVGAPTAPAAQPGPPVVGWTRPTSVPGAAARTAAPRPRVSVDATERIAPVHAASTTVRSL